MIKICDMCGSNVKATGKGEHFWQSTDKEAVGEAKEIIENLMIKVEVEWLRRLDPDNGTDLYFNTILSRARTWLKNNELK